MTSKILFSALLALSLGASARNISVATGSAWPPAAGTALTAVSGGNMHIGIIDVDASQPFCFADYADGGDPARMAPAGTVTVSSDSHSFHTMPRISAGADNTIESRPAVERRSAGFTTQGFDLWTDKARYNPGDEVWIQCSKFNEYRGATVRYRRGFEIIGEETLRQEWWPWKAPADDFQGYLVEVVWKENDGSETILGSIAVDVSSDWRVFPRYGYVAWYEPGKEQYVGGDVAFLNRRHINAVQFQDWHNKHHAPYCGDAVYKDIANRDVSLNVVRSFIDTQHGYNMLAFFYNLGYGAFERAGAAEDGVREEWYYYRDQNHSQKCYHYLPDSWKSSITLVDPGNADWQRYLCDRNEEVYANLAFDGFQVDQLGDPGETYDYWGNRIWLADRFPGLLHAFHDRHPSKRLIMNSVSGHARRQIASSGVIDVCYNEMWTEAPGFHDIYSIIADNKRDAGSQDMRTIFANYMNYDFAENNNANFNNPGVLLTDACIFALGGSHLELGTGGNMLCREYFPATNLHMDDALVDAITRYYDFATAYENYLYATDGEVDPTYTVTSGHQIITWNEGCGPKARKIALHAKHTKSGANVMHLINFTGVNSMSWRDLDATMPEPAEQTGITLNLDVDYSVQRVWVASPDSHACAPIELPYTQQGRSITLTVPSLKYWTMLVLE